MSHRIFDSGHAGLFPAEAGPTNSPRASIQAGAAQLQDRTQSAGLAAIIVGPALAGNASGVTPHI